MKNNFEKLQVILEKISQFIDKSLTSKKNIKIVSLVVTLSIFVIVGLTDGLSSVFDLGYRSGVVLSEIPVNVQLNEQAYEVTGIPNVVDASLVGDLPELQEIVLKRNLKVGVDLDTLKEGSHSVKLIAIGATENVKVTLNPSVVNVTIRKKVAKKYAFKHDFINVNPESDLSLGEPRFAFDKIDVIASEFNHEKIKYVNAIVDVKKASSDVVATVNFAAYDEHGMKLDVTIQPDSTTVPVEINKPKKEVPIKIKTVGQLSDSTKAIDSIDISDSTTTLYGSTEALKNIQFAEVVIPLDKLESNARLQLPIVLPNGITASSLKRVDVSITFANKQTRQIDLPIVLKDANPDYDISVVSNQVRVEVSGSESQLNSVLSEKILISPILSSLKEGEMDVALQVEKPATLDVKLLKEVVKIIVKKR